MYNKNEILYKIHDLERRIDKSVVKRCDALPENNVGRILIYDGGVYFWNGITYEQLLSTDDDVVTQQELIDALAGIGIGTNINVVDTYNDLPDADLHSGEFYWVTNSIGTQWLPGSLGGTYYKKGLYYSVGLTWETAPVPYQATLAEVNSELVQDKFVTPYTHANSNKWDTKANVSHTHPISDVLLLQDALDSKLSSIPSEYITETELTTELADYVLDTDPRLSDDRDPTAHTHIASEITDFDTEVSNNTDVAANTAARHTHANQAILDNTTGTYTNTKDTKLAGIQAGATLNSTDVFLIDRTNHTGTQAIATVTGLQTALDDKSAVGHTHTSSEITDFQASVSANTDVSANTTARHSHSNIAILNAITEAFTTALKTAYDNAVTWITTNGTNLLNHLSNTSNPHSVTKAQVGLSDVDNVSAVDLRDRSTHTGSQTSSTISDFDESVEDIIGAKIIPGSNISVTYNDTTGETEISSTYTAPSPTGNIVLEFFESGEDLTTGIKDVPISIPYTATITGWEIAAYDVDDNLIIGDAVIDILSDSFTNLPLTSLDSIAGTELPTLISQNKNNDYTITTFTPIPTGNYLQGEIVSVSAGIVKIIVVLYTTKS